MNPAAQLSTSLLVALALWFPSLTATLRGDLELPTAATRYLVAFLLTKAAIALLSRLVQTYAATPPALVGEPVLDLADGESVRQRRREDPDEDAA